MASLKGEAAVRKKLKKLERTIPQEVGAALYQEALIITADSMRHTPVEFGTLRDSHETSAPRWKGKTLQVDIQVGGPAAPYAVIVHEDTSVRHAPPWGQGGNAKFLENAVLGAAPTLRDKIAKRIKLNRMV